MPRIFISFWQASRKALCLSFTRRMYKSLSGRPKAIKYESYPKDRVIHSSHVQTKKKKTIMYHFFLALSDSHEAVNPNPL